MNTEEAVPEWWHPLQLSAEQQAQHPSRSHHIIGDEDAERWLWRYIRQMQPGHRKWLFDPANVHCERRFEFGSGTELNAYWCHRWVFTRVGDGSQLAQVYITPYFCYNHSKVEIDDGTNDLIPNNDVKGMARVWEKGIDLKRVMDF